MSGQRTFAVTGVTTGIGHEICRQLKSRGDYVIGFDIKAPHQFVDEYIPIDLGDPDSILKATQKIDQPLDGLCNNAGIPPREGLEIPILSVNFLGQRQFTDLVIPKLSPGSPILNLASRAGQGWRQSIDQILALMSLTHPDELEAYVTREGINATRAYNLSKEAMILWTILSTEELIALNLRMNTLSPGAVTTGIIDDFAKAFGDKMANNVKRAGRPASPEEVAQIAVFMLSDESNWIKGTDIPIDGGMGAFAVADQLKR